MMVLRIKRGRDIGRTYPIEKDSVVIGRDNLADVTIPDEAASRKHAEVFCIGEMYFVKDLESRNGTLVNDKPAEEELLRVGDRIRIGSTLLVFEDESTAGEGDEEVTYADEGDVETTGILPLAQLGLEAKATREHFGVLYDIVKDISSERALEPMLERVATAVHEAVSSDETYVFVEIDGQLKPMAVKKTKGGESVSRSIIGNVMKTGRSVLTSDASTDSRFKSSESIVMKGIRSVICAPLVSMQKAKGVIYAVKRSLQEKFTDDDLELASAIAMITGVSIQGLEALDQHKKFLLDMVKTLVAATEMRDASARGHSRRVAAICGAISDVMKIPPERKERIELAGLLHDIGKIGVSEYGLHSVGQIQDDIKGGKLAHHVIMGEKIISRMPELADIAEAVKTHHEAWDGSGYPRGLKRDQIPLMGRIVAAANAFEQLLSRGGEIGDSMSIKKALMQIGKLAGRKYDPEVVKALLIAHRNGSLSFDTGPEDL